MTLHTIVSADHEHPFAVQYWGWTFSKQQALACDNINNGIMQRQTMSVPYTHAFQSLRSTVGTLEMTRRLCLVSQVATDLIEDAPARTHSCGLLTEPSIPHTHQGQLSTPHTWDNFARHTHTRTRDNRTHHSRTRGCPALAICRPTRDNLAHHIRTRDNLPQHAHT